MKLKYLVFITIFFAARLALGASLFGAEFSLTNEEIMKSGARKLGTVNTPEALAGQKALLEEFTRSCLSNSSCQVQTVKNSFGLSSYRVIFPQQNNFWVQISTDPSVVEIQTKPSTTEEYIKAKSVIDDLFKAGEAVNLKVDRGGMGGGHIHMDFKSTFGNDPQLFRDFLVDFMNHQELGGPGVFGADSFNSPHLSQLFRKEKNEFRRVIEEFDAGKIRSARDLAKEINRRVYSNHPQGVKPPEKYHALNLTRMLEADGQSTIEFRALGPQRSAEEFIQQTKLFESRVEFLKKQNKRVQLQSLDTFLDPKEKIAAYRSYVEESNLDWNEYRKLVRNDAHLATADILPLTRMNAVQRAPLPPAPSNVCRDSFKKLGSFFGR